MHTHPPPPQSQWPELTPGIVWYNCVSTQTFFCTRTNVICLLVCVCTHPAYLFICLLVCQCDIMHFCKIVYVGAWVPTSSSEFACFPTDGRLCCCSFLVLTKATSERALLHLSLCPQHPALPSGSPALSPRSVITALLMVNRRNRCCHLQPRNQRSDVYERERTEIWF